MRIAFIAALLVCILVPYSAARSADAKVEVGKDVCLIQGFEGDDVFAKKQNISYLSGVPEESEVEFWDLALYGRKRFARDESGIVCAISTARKTEGKSSLEARFTRSDRALRVSLRNNLDQPADAGPRPPMNGLGWFDALHGDIFNAGDKPVAVELRLLGGYAVTDKSLPLSAVKTLQLKPGWNDFCFTAEESSAVLADPFDATSVEFRVPEAKDAVLCFDNFRMERESIGKNLAALAKCFDFGVEYMNWPGFAYGSRPYDNARGFGFAEGQALTHGGDLHVFNDLLTRDGFRAPATFKLKLPNGKYKAVALTGNYWGRRDTDLNVQIKANGKVAYDRPRLGDDQRVKAKFAEEKIDHDRRDMDLWGAYEEGGNFHTIGFDAEVADGTLTLEFLLPPLEAGARPGGESIWNYLIVYPADKEELIAPELKWLKEKIARIYNKVSHAKFGREFALYNREEVICPEEYLWPDLADARRKALRPTEQETQRGYLHFLRDHHDLVTPDSVPRPDETGDRVVTFGSLGETVQWTVGLYPLKDLAKVGVALTDLKDADGKVISGKSAEIMLVSYRPMTPVTSGHSEPFNYTGPGVLMPPWPIDIPKEYPRQFWISLPIPADASPGLYRGQVVVSLAGQPASTVEVALRVLPFVLEEPKDVTFAVAHSSTRSFWPAEEFYELEFYKRMGLNTLWAAPGAEFKDTLDKQAAHYGLKLEVASDKYVNWRWPEEYRDAVVRRTIAQGKSVSFQPTHTGYREGRHVRFSHGFWLWRSAIRHRVIQTQPNACERVYYAHAGHAKFGPCNYLFPSMDRVGLLLPGPSWYDVRDGIYDWRYIQTLESLVKSDQKLPGLVRASSHLEELKASLNPNLDFYYFRRKRDFNHVDRFGLYDTVWHGQRFSMERWELARHIAAVKGATVISASKPAAEKHENVIFFQEYFGPFWVDDRQAMLVERQQERQGEPGLLGESPKTLVGRNNASVLATLQYPSDQEWVAVLKDSEGKELARQNVGKLQRWKTRWLLQTSHLPVGRYALSIAPADAKAQMEKPPSAEIVVLPGIE